MTDKATPRPWEVFAPHQLADSLRIFSGTHCIGSIGNSEDSVEVTNANAALIVKAVNLHDELLKTIQQMKDLISSGNWEVESEINNLEDSLDYILTKAKE